MPSDLFAFYRLPEDPNGVGLHRLREFPEDERERCQDAGRLLAAMGPYSPYADLMRENMRWIRAVDEFAAQGPGAGGIELEREVESAFKNWLGGFRSFDDRTSAWISDQLGKSHPAYSAFKDGLSAEFDANLAYRLCWGLRNASTHAGNVISAVRSEHLVDDVIERTFKIQVDGPQIAERFLGISKKRRDEFAELDSRLDAQFLVYAVMESCERAYCILLEMLRPDVAAAIERITAVQREAQDFDSTASAVFMEASIVSESPPQQLPLEFVRFDLVPVLRRALEDSAGLANAPPTSWAEDSLS